MVTTNFYTDIIFIFPSFSALSLLLSRFDIEKVQYKKLIVLICVVMYGPQDKHCQETLAAYCNVEGPFNPSVKIRANTC